jgi:cytochrome P450
MDGPNRLQDFDALAPETFDSTHAVYADLRERCPVAYSHAWGGFWALMKYDDVVRAAGDFRTYTTTVQNVVPKVAFTGRRPPLHLDPPEHTPFRRALNPLFASGRIKAMEAPVRRFVVELLQPLIDKGEGDICGEFSSHLPIRVFAEWMNIDEVQAEELRKVGRAFNVAVQSNIDDVVKETSLQLYAIARALIEERKTRPLDPASDAVTALLAARDNGEPLNEELILGCIRQVLVVGIIAPTVMIGSIAVHLARDPKLQQKLRAEPGIIPDALEEFLRLYTPYRGFARTPTCPVSVRGRDIVPGEPIALVYASANRDDAKFERGSEFILGRENISEHIAFGRGPHSCPGAPLARLQLRLALEELLARTSAFELAGEITPTRMPEIGALHVPLKFAAA